jgi:nitrogen-specific signal transduction histidine kinase
VQALQQRVCFCRHQTGITLGIRSVQLAEGIPDVMADRVQLQQVFMNLMVNAIEAMRDTGGDLTVASRPARRFSSRCPATR